VSNAEVGIHHQIAELVSREHALREELRSGAISADAERGQLQEVEAALDQCWDLLRQRDALRSAGKNPDEATARPIEQVEGYRG
jgi:phage terminase Nu1 subunit (DNA packaging protein)